MKKTIRQFWHHAHSTWRHVRTGYNNYLAVPVNLATFLTIFEGIILYVVPALRTLAAGGVGVISFLLLMAMAYGLGKHEERAERRR